MMEDQYASRIAVTVVDDMRDLDVAWLHGMLKTTNWARKRPIDFVKRSVENSKCFLAIEDSSGRHIGFARVVTDYVTFAWICDVIVEPACRGRGVGSALLKAIVHHPDLENVAFHLGTDTPAYYERFGFSRHQTMCRGRTSRSTQ